MDPNATLSELDRMERARGARFLELVDALRGWLNSGGFEPDWGKYPRGTARWYRTMRRGGFQVPARGY